MDQLIPIVNQLQDVFTAIGCTPVELPILVVVGSQSSGKSSVLENIVGRDFLPRGTDIVTRRPLILQLCNTQHIHQNNNTPNNDDAASLDEHKGAEWGEFLHQRGRRYDDFGAIREEIMRETDRITGQNKGISASPISLKIYSPHVLNLTLVDLPGLTKVAVGDQPSDIERQVRDLILSYISSPHSIIIAVTPANADLATSDALKLAQRVDPHGARTLGVITKIDLMDRGTDALNVLCGKVIPLHHGFVGVINRSQHDIHQNKSIQAALKAERLFFQSNAVYRPIASRLGTPFLAKKLNQLLLHHIQSSLPELRQKIMTNAAEAKAELESYGKPIEQTPDNLAAILLPILSRYCTHLCDALEGRIPEVSTSQLYGGARISYVFHEVYTIGLEHIHPFDTLSDHDIRTAIRNATGPRPSLFIPEIAFELLVKKQIERLLQPSVDCVDLVFQELQRVAHQCEQLSPELIRFPVLRTRLLSCVRDTLKRYLDPTKDMIHNLINIELAYINTNHPDFIGGSRAVSAIMDKLHAQAQAQAQTQSQAQSQSQSQSQSNKQHGTIAIPPAQTSTKQPSVLQPTKQIRSASAARADSDNDEDDEDDPTRVEGASRATAASRTGRGGVGGTSSLPTSPQPSGLFGLLFRSNTTSASASVSASASPSPALGASSSALSPPAIAPSTISTRHGHATRGHREREHQRERERQHHESSHRSISRSRQPRSPSTSPSTSPTPVPQQSQPPVIALDAVARAPASMLEHDLHPGSQLQINMQSLIPTDRELIETEIIKTLILSYFSIVRKNICDSVPKSIMCCLVNAFKQQIQSECVKQLYQPNLFKPLLEEGGNIAEKRAACSQVLSVLQRATDIINQTRDQTLDMTITADNPALTNKINNNILN